MSHISRDTLSSGQGYTGQSSGARGPGRSSAGRAPGRTSGPDATLAALMGTLTIEHMPGEVEDTLNFPGEHERRRVDQRIAFGVVAPRRRRPPAPPRGGVGDEREA